MIPYIIYAPDYTNGSAGVRALHKLCHDLNEKGYKSYVTARTINKEWNAPTIPDRLFPTLINKGCNMVYPEIVPGNRYHAKRVIRYLLNEPGLWGGDKVYDKNEIIFSYLPHFIQPNQPKKNILTLTVIEKEIFNREGVADRKFSTYYFGKYDYDNNLKRGIEETDNIKIVKRLPPNPPTRKEVAKLLKNSNVFYCYDDFTAMLDEARLCGCPAVVYTKHDRSFYKRMPGGDDGLAIGNDPVEIKYAKETVNNFSYEKIWKNYPKQLAHFIKVTQQ